ncbi:MAG: 1-acyl-sn-glycerol-3-phosphate acyltransferase [Caulobacterales bacterium]|jgi:1-acyl-sn-glycerol-3-phosphate acyltransferase
MTEPLPQGRASDIDPPVRRELDRTTAKPAPYRGVGSEIIRTLSRIYLALNGWKMQGDWPGLDKVVLIAAPHTSNWDGFNMLAAAGYYRIKLRWMGKKSLIKGPLGWLIKATGVVPIDRAASNDVVAQMRQAFAQAQRMVLAISPEGTRTLAPVWKRGYYHIARGADVPLVISVLDYGAKTISLSGVLNATGDYADDYRWIAQHYVGVGPKFPDQFTLEDPSKL